MTLKKNQKRTSEIKLCENDDFNIYHDGWDQESHDELKRFVIIMLSDPAKTLRFVIHCIEWTHQAPETAQAALITLARYENVRVSNSENPLRNESRLEETLSDCFSNPAFLHLAATFLVAIKKPNAYRIYGWKV